jgi:hypothetical protein
MAELEHGPTRSESRELFEIFERILWDWSCLTVSPVEVSSDQYPHLDLECGVRITGGKKAFLTVRGPKGFAESLASRMGLGGDGQNWEHAFVELVNIFCGHLMTDLSLMKDFAYAGYLPERTQPRDWPPRDPNAQCRVYTDRHMVEIQLWLENDPVSV